MANITNQHNSLVTWNNPASVPKKMRMEYNKNQEIEIAKSLQETLIGKVSGSIEEQFASNCNIRTEDKVNWAKRIHINSKNTIDNQAEVVVILSQKWKITINMTPLDRIEEGYFLAEDLDFINQLGEIENIKKYFDTWSLPKNSKLKRVGFFDEWDGIKTENFDGTKIASNFWNFTQEEYERIEKSEWPSAAQKYANNSVK